MSAERQTEALAGAIRQTLIARRREAAARPGTGSVDLRSEIAELVAEQAALLSEPAREEIERIVVRETVGLGPLEALLGDPTVEEILVNGPEEVWVERGGLLARGDVSFDGPDHVLDVIERMLGPLGRRVDELEPMADARLPDGSRVNVVIPPLAVDGATISIRRFSALRPGPEALVESGSVPVELMGLLEDAVASGENLLVSGGTGSGKTTLINALAGFIPPGQRVITIEDAAELRLDCRHVVRLESRPAGVEGRGEVPIRELLRNALRMRPDRIIIGEVRGGEALDLVSALNTGHRGALSTVHANSPAEALERLELLALQAGIEIPHAVIGSQIRSAIDLVLHLRRGEGGRREAVELARVVQGQEPPEVVWGRGQRR